MTDRVQDPEVLEECKEICEIHLIGKKTDDFLILGPTDRHFLFTMRMRYLANKEDPQNKPLYCSPKQLKYMKDLIESVKVDGGESKKIELALREAAGIIRKKQSAAISKETKRLSEELGLKNKKILRRRLEELLSS